MRKAKSFLIVTLLVPPVAAAQQLIGANPEWGGPGQTLEVIISCDPDHIFTLPAHISFSPASEISTNDVWLVDIDRLGASLSIPADAACGAQDITVGTSLYEFQGKGIFHVCDPQSQARLLSIQPATGYPGDTLRVTVTGQDTHFVQGSSRLSLGEGISVSGVAVSSSTSLQAQIDISPTATAGKRDVSVITGGETATGPGLFQVSATEVALRPNQGRQGSTLDEVEISGSWGNFSSSTRADLGKGVSIGSLRCPDAYHLVLVNVQIALDAPVGGHTLRLSNPFLEMADAFIVLQGPETKLLSVTPSHGDRGHPGLVVELVGQNTHFDEKDRRVRLSAAHTSASNYFASSPTQLKVTLLIGREAPEGLADVTVALGQGAGCSMCEEVTLANGFEITAPGEVLIVDPAEVQPENNMTVSVAASDGHFQEGETQVFIDPPQGVEILSVEVNDADHLQFTLNVTADASGEPRDLILVTGTEVAVGPGKFDVFQPAIRSLFPAIGLRGTTMHLVVQGTDVEFSNACTLTFSGTGVEVLSTAVDAADHSQLLVDIAIAADAPLGARDVTVTCGTVSLVAEGAFAVTKLGIDGDSKSGCSCSAGSGLFTQLSPLWLLPLLRRRPRR